jgi:hypothetical protein
LRELALPVHQSIASRELHDHLQLLSKQRIIIVDAIAEERKGLDELAAARHDFGAAIGD